MKRASSRPGAQAAAPWPLSGTGRRPGWALVALLGLLTSCGEPEEGPPGSGRTIVLLTIDTLRQDAMGAYGAAEASTPAMDGLAAESTRFVGALAPAPLTLPSHVTMLSGLPPVTTGVRTNAAFLPRERGFSLLAEALARAGWTCAAFVSASVLGRQTGLDAGFALYDDGALEDAGSLALAERPGTQTVSAALAHVRALPAAASLFLWVHLFEPHAPYAWNGRYAGDVEVADRAVAALLEGLEDLGRLDTVLLTSDHGEALGALGEPTHGLLLGREVLEVPFLLRLRGRKASVAHGHVALADVAPTLASVASVPWPRRDGPGAGRDLLASEPSGDRILFAEGLQGHARYGWAQLSAAAGPDAEGIHRLVVDAGAGRIGLVGEGGRAAPAPGAESALRPLVAALHEYRAGEARAAARPARAPQPYGGGSPARPFLPPEENARLPDPYARVPDAVLLDRLAAAIAALPQSRRALEAAQERLASLHAQDPGNPEAAFWLGMALEARSNLPGASPDLKARAEEAYLRAFELGRRDGTTLWKAAGVNAAGHERQALARLDALLPRLEVPDCQVWLLKARLHRALGQEPETRRACEEARRHCQTRREEGLWRAVCARGS